MTRLSAIGFFVALSLAPACSDTSSSAAPSRGAHARTLVEGGATLVDVRSEREFAAGHLEGAVHIPVNELGQRLDELPREGGLVVYCQSGGRSAQAASFLDAEGFEVYDLGGIGEWE